MHTLRQGPNLKQGRGQFVVPQKPLVQLLWVDAGPWHSLLMTSFSPLEKNMPDDVLILDVVKDVFLSSDPVSTTTLGASLGSAALMMASHSSATQQGMGIQAQAATQRLGYTAPEGQELRALDC